MARYKYIDTNPRFLAVDLARQLLPGTFEHALNHLLDHAIDLSHFDARFRNDTTGASAYPPALLLKVVLFAYSQGIVSSRGIERACQEHVTFIALCGDRAAFHDDRALCEHPGRGHRAGVRGGGRDLRCPRLDRPRDVRHRRGEAPEQCLEAAEWDAGRL